MKSLFSKLEYNYTAPPGSNQVTEYSEETKKTLSSIPNILDDWQYEAIANNDLTGYTYNPVANTMNSIVEAVLAVYSNCFQDPITLSNSYLNLANVTYTVNTMIHYSGPDPTENLTGARADTTNSMYRFLEHTNRLSGVAPFEAINSDLPHYDNAMSVGKSLAYVMYQSDGITNNAPIIGSFTSLFINDTIRVAANTLWNISVQLANSSDQPVYDPLDPTILIGYNIVLNPANETANIIIKMERDLANISSNTFTERRIHDERFFKNAKQIMDDMNKMQRYKDPGQTETNFLKNFIGTDKLKNKNSKFK